jgi:hypothetical protein
MRTISPWFFPIFFLALIPAGCSKTAPATAQNGASPGPAVPAKAPAPVPVATVAPGAALAQQTDASAGPHFTGEVTRGQRFEKNVGSGLVFRLEPDAVDDSGWSIRLAPASEPSPASMDCIGSVSEPLHGSNKLSIDPSSVSIVNGRTYWFPDFREFYFVTNPLDCKSAWDLANAAYYPSKLTAQEREQASEKLFHIRTGHGSFKILDSRVNVPAGEKKPGAIEWLKFEVELNFSSAPDMRGSSAESAHKSGGAIREIDLEKFLKTRYAEVQPDLEHLEEECGENQQRIHSVKILYGDLDGDAQDEAAYEGFTCMSGTAGVDFFGVLKMQPDGKLIALPIEGERKEFKGRRNLYEGLRGHLSLEIKNGRLLEVFPVYASEGGANCCPEGGKREFVYRWDGQQFVLDDIIDVPPEKDGS